jgi:Barstar (barnase inhibitor)
MPARLGALVAGEYPPGVYRWRSRAHPGAIGRELVAAGWVGYDLPGVSDSAQLLEECARILTFPAWFGHTWEGLGDCLADLSWLSGKGHVVLWERYGALAGGDGKAWQRAYETLERAVAARVRYAAPPLFVLLRGTGPDVSPVDGRPIPVLPLASGRAGSTGGGNPGSGAARVSATAGSRPRRAR